MRVMAIDYGDARTGVAVSDLTATLCGDAFTIQEWDPARLAARIAREAREREVGRLVLGLPRNMDGTEGAPGGEEPGVSGTFWRRRPGCR